MRRSLFWLSDDQWQRITPLLPTDARGKGRGDDRRVISGILVDVHSAPPPEIGQSFDNFSFLGLGRMDNLLKAHS